MKFSQLSVLLALGASVALKGYSADRVATNVLASSAIMAATNPIPKAPAVLPGQGLAQHDFFYAGMAIGNEFSDHKFEKDNYLNLAGSKLRNCSLGPELVIDPQFESVPGQVTIERAGREFWSKKITTGETEMCHSLRNIEQHHFKFETHRRPGDVHMHYFGACAWSFGDGVQLADGDVMSISFAGFGRALRNLLRVATGQATLITVKSLV